MKKLFLLSTVLIFLLGFTASHAVDEKVNRLLQQFAITEETAKADILNGVAGPSFFIPNVKTLKTLSSGERVSIVQLMGQNIKAYLASEAFIGEYNQYREDRKPAPPEEPKYTVQIKNEQRENLKKGIAELEKNKAQIAKDQQAMFDEIIKGLNEQLQQIDDPNNPMFTPEMDTYIKQSYDMQMSEYAKSVADWENTYPQDNPNPMIKKWITTFLDTSAGIDFDANTTEVSPGKIKFTNPEYEQKDSQWKLYFRAGKETVTAARTFAQDWLRELK